MRGMPLGGGVDSIISESMAAPHDPALGQELARARAVLETSRKSGLQLLGAPPSVGLCAAPP